MLRELGPLGLLCVPLGAFGVVVALVTLVLLAAKKAGAVKVAGLLCLVTAGGALVLGALGYFLSTIALNASLPNVPFDMKNELLLKGTLDARLILFVALVAAAFPFLVGSLAMVVTRFRVGIGAAVIVAVGLTMTLGTHARPLPPGKVTLAQVEGLELPHSTAQRRPPAQPLIALTAEGLWVEGSKVSSLALALEDPRVRAQNPDVLPLAVDGRVASSDLVDVLDAAGRANRHEFELVVQSPGGDLAVIRVRDAASLPSEPTDKPPLLLTLRVSGMQVELLAVGGALDPLPVDWHQVQAKLKEVKAAFPDETSLRVIAAPEVSVAVLVNALDAARETEARALLFPDVALGRFEAPVADSGGVDQNELAGFVRQHKAEIQQCYEKELKRAPTLAGKVVVLFSITPSGHTSAIDIEENTLGNEAVANCLEATIRGWLLPFRPVSDVPVAYPFVFAPAN